MVYIAPSKDFLSRWADDLKLSHEMYREAGVTVSAYSLAQLDIDNAKITIAPGGLFTQVMSRLTDIQQPSDLLGYDDNAITGKRS